MGLMGLSDGCLPCTHRTLERLSVKYCLDEISQDDGDDDDDDGNDSP